MMRFLSILLVLSAAVIVTGCGDDDGGETATVETTETVAAETTSTTAGGELFVELAELNGSGVSGSATITQVDDDTARVLLELTGADEDAPPMPAHIHVDTCETPGAVKYPLENVVDGVSDTELDITAGDLVGGPMLVNVHKSEDEINTYVACGELPAAGGAAATDGDDAAATTGDTAAGTATTDSAGAGDTDY